MWQLCSAWKLFRCKLQLNIKMRKDASNHVDCNMIGGAYNELVGVFFGNIFLERNIQQETCCADKNTFLMWEVKGEWPDKLSERKKRSLMLQWTQAHHKHILPWTADNTWTYWNLCILRLMPETWEPWMKNIQKTPTTKKTHYTQRLWGSPDTEELQVETKSIFKINVETDSGNRLM